MRDEDEDLQEADLAAREAGLIGGPSPESDEDGLDEAMRPVYEAGGGEAEGFEEAERELIQNAAHGDLGHSPRNDAFAPELESDLAGAEYASADEVEVSEREDRDELSEREDRDDDAPTAGPGGHASADRRRERERGSRE